jgi:ADP-ribose pyrophosphatase YjhB (NUDIX family)
MAPPQAFCDYFTTDIDGGTAWFGVAAVADIIKLAEHRRSANKPVQIKTKSPKLRKHAKGHKWPEFSSQTVFMPLAAELIRETGAPRSPGPDAILESGVLAFRRQHGGEPLVLLISKIRSKKWGIPKGRVVPYLGFQENAAKEAFEEAGVVGYVSSSSVGMFRARKAAANAPGDRVIEVWVYLLEVTEMLPDWPERDKRTIRWVTCEVAARQLREPVLTHLCHRLAQRAGA